MKLLILDTETNGLDPKEHDVIEVAAALFDCKHRIIIQQLSTLLPAKSNPQEAINKIPVDALDWSYFPLNWMTLIEAMYSESDHVVAHNANFDKGFVAGILPHLAAEEWVDSMDIPFPCQQRQGESLVNLAVNHGIPVVSAHRALDDCQLLAKLLGTLPDIEGAIAYAMRPKATFKALVSYDDRHLASKAGFGWDKAVKGCWSKRMAIEDVEKLPFRVVHVGD